MANMPPYGVEIVTPAPSDTTPAPVAEQDGKITYTPEQQAHLNEVIKEAQGRAARELRAENARLKAELDAAKRTPSPAADSTETLLRLAQVERERDELRAAQHESTVNSALLSAAGNLFIDPALATRLMRDNVKVIDGKVVPVDETGNVRLNNSFEPMTLKDLAIELGTQRPYLARGEVRGGSGSTPSNRPLDTGVSLERLFGRNSNGAEANKLAMHNPQKYRELRALARERGLI
jgi:hypothetical protein